MEERHRARTLPSARPDERPLPEVLRPAGHSVDVEARSLRPLIGRPIAIRVATHEEKPFWELEGKPPPHDTRFETEAERLRRERTRAWRERLEERERRRARTSVPPPPSKR